MSERKTQTRREFETEYNGGDIKYMVIHGRLSIECPCDYEACTGWKMTHLDNLADDALLYGVTPEQITMALAHRLDLVAQFKLEEERNLE
jgi:hypothetical protein